MRKILFRATAAALLLASSPALAAGPCPATRDEARALLAGLPSQGAYPLCFNPCYRAIKYGPKDLKIFGVQPVAVIGDSGRDSLNSVIFILPGGLGKYAAGFKKAFAGASCSSAGDHCYVTLKAPADALQQPELLQSSGDPNTYLHCRFIFSMG